MTTKVRHVNVKHGKVIFTREYSSKTSDVTIALDLHKRGMSEITEPEIKAAVQIGAVDMRHTQQKEVQS